MVVIRNVVKRLFSYLPLRLFTSPFFCLLGYSRDSYQCQQASQRAEACWVSLLAQLTILWRRLLSGVSLHLQQSQVIHNKNNKEEEEVWIILYYLFKTLIHVSNTAMSFFLWDKNKVADFVSSNVKRLHFNCSISVSLSLSPSLS